MIRWKKLKIITAVLSVICVLVCVAAAVQFAGKERERQKVSNKEFFAMNTYFSLRAYGAGGAEALSLCEEEAARLESIFSVTEQESDISRLNREKSVNVSDDTFLLVAEAMEVGRQTEGALDITLYPVLKEWGFTTGEYRIPDEDRLKELLKGVDFGQIKAEKLPEEEASYGYRYHITIPDEAQLDLGAVAKGYTGDKMLEILKNQGITSAILDLGGNVQTLGEKPDGSPWKVAVRDPFDRNRIAGVLTVTDKSVITSGGYERYFTGEDGKVYWHILDPKTGHPADSGLLSVTIVGGSGVRCDALSTALFVMGRENAVDFWRNHRDFGMILIEESGEIRVTEDLEDCFECGENFSMTVIHGAGK